MGDDRLDAEDGVHEADFVLMKATKSHHLILVKLRERLPRGFVGMHRGTTRGLVDIVRLLEAMVAHIGNGCVGNVEAKVHAGRTPESGNLGLGGGI